VSERIHLKDPDMEQTTTTPRTTTQPVPTPDSESAPFWNNARAGVLSVQRCEACGLNRFPATTYCPRCRSAQMQWVPCSGRGEIFSWIVVRHPVPAAAYKSEVPYVVALVTLEEGPRIVSNIVGCPPADIRANMPVQVGFTERDGVVLPVFRPQA